MRDADRRRYRYNLKKVRRRRLVIMEHGKISKQAWTHYEALVFPTATELYHDKGDVNSETTKLGGGDKVIISCVS